MACLGIHDTEVEATHESGLCGWAEGAGRSWWSGDLPVFTDEVEVSDYCHFVQ